MRLDPHRRVAEGFCEVVKACPLSEGGAPHHGQPGEGPLDWPRLRPSHVAIDDATRLAYVQVLEDEQQGAAMGFLNRAVPCFIRPGHGLPAGDVGQRPCLRLTQLCQGLRGPWSTTHQHQAGHPLNQGQCRMLYGAPVPGKALRDGSKNPQSDLIIFDS